jgi:hypothetical protein
VITQHHRDVEGLQPDHPALEGGTKNRSGAFLLPSNEWKAQGWLRLVRQIAPWGHGKAVPHCAQSPEPRFAIFNAKPTSRFPESLCMSTLAPALRPSGPSSLVLAPDNPLTTPPFATPLSRNSG